MKLECHKLLSTLAFNFSLRRYTVASIEAHMAAHTALLLQIQSDIAALAHNAGPMRDKTAMYGTF